MNIATGFLVCAVGAATANAIDLVADPGFRQGFYVKDRDGKEKVLCWQSAAGPNKNQTPVWHTAQHASKSCFADAVFCKFRNNGLTFHDDFQTLIVHPEDNDADIILGVNALKEYGGVWRQPGDPWPHLYLQQDISHPQGWLGSVAPTVANLERLNLEISLRLLYDHQHKGPEFNPNVHAAQFILFLTVQNLNRQSKGFGDYYWFGISLYDNRHEVTQFFAMQDISQARKKGTEKFIYDVGIAPFTSAVVAQGNWVAVRGDVLPYIRAGLAECWKRGFLRDSKDPADYRVSGIFLGWEIPGLNDAAVAVKNLSLIATPKSKP
ncbi:MAG: hypothetical protein ACLQNE_17290 [Thermoguttaceae bacterium]